MKKIALLVSLVLALALLSVAALTVQGAETPAVRDQAPVVLQTTPPVTATEELEIPFLEEWLSSGHADVTAEAFRHWDEEDPAEVPASCAKCHSSPGYQDFLGIDGTAAGVVDNPAPINTVVTCVTCHNQGTITMTSVVMPSGVELTGLGDEARCMQCHQGRASTVHVTEAISQANVTDEDTVSEELSFINIHYFAAAATKYGTHAMGGYQYEGKSYEGNFAHVASFDTCIECHSPHTLQLRLEGCAECHTDVTSVEDLQDVRMAGSQVDYDGDGDLEEGIYFETQGLQEMLMQAMQAYGTEVVESPIVYDSASHPYFFVDTNANGEVDEGEATSENRYASWTPRLLKAAYNYQVSIKDPGEFAHGGKYIIQLLYDSIEDLNTALSDPVDLSEAHRNDAGHFAGSEEAFRHWDEEGMVPADCSKCHSAAGLPMFLENEATIAVPPANGFECATCHDDVANFTRYQVEEVTFPSGATAAFENLDANLCLQCHQGRVSSVQVDEAIEQADVDDDTVSEALGFQNPHYFAAGATLWGSEVAGAYQYADQEYVGRFMHVPDYDTCVGCHNTHGLTVKVEECSQCHTGVETEEDLTGIRMDMAGATDYDGDGDSSEGIAGEIETMHEMLYEAIQAYAAETAGTAVVYNGQRHPYFFIDANENGEPDPDETDRYNAWTPSLLRAAYNYQWVAKDPGAFAHNSNYIMQILYDSLDAMGADVSGMVRPES